MCRRLSLYRLQKDQGLGILKSQYLPVTMLTSKAQTLRRKLQYLNMGKTTAVSKYTSPLTKERADIWLFVRLQEIHWSLADWHRVGVLAFVPEDTFALKPETAGRSSRQQHGGRARWGGCIG